MGLKRDRINTTSVKLKSISKKNNNSLNAIYFFNNSHKSYLINNVLLKNDIDFDLDFYKAKPIILIIIIFFVFFHQ